MASRIKEEEPDDYELPSTSKSTTAAESCPDMKPPRAVKKEVKQEPESGDERAVRKPTRKPISRPKKRAPRNKKQRLDANNELAFTDEEDDDDTTDGGDDDDDDGADDNGDEDARIRQLDEYILAEDDGSTPMPGLQRPRIKVERKRRTSKRKTTKSTKKGRKKKKTTKKRKTTTRRAKTSSKSLKMATSTAAIAKDKPCATLQRATAVMPRLSITGAGFVPLPDDDIDEPIEVLQTKRDQTNLKQKAPTVRQKNPLPAATGRRHLVASSSTPTPSTSSPLDLLDSILPQQELLLAPGRYKDIRDGQMVYNERGQRWLNKKQEKELRNTVSSAPVQSNRVVKKENSVLVKREIKQEPGAHSTFDPRRVKVEI